MCLKNFIENAGGRVQNFKKRQDCIVTKLSDQDKTPPPKNSQGQDYYQEFLVSCRC